jgi:hypothetical protein
MLKTVSRRRLFFRIQNETVIHLSVHNRFELSHACLQQKAANKAGEFLSKIAAELQKPGWFL